MQQRADTSFYLRKKTLIRKWRRQAGRKYNKMLERKLWHCSVAVRAAARYITNSTVPLWDHQHGSLVCSSRETLTADRSWETRCGWRDSRIPAKLESWRDWWRRLPAFRSVIGWGYSETREDQNDDGRTKVILRFTGKGLGNVQRVMMMMMTT